MTENKYCGYQGLADFKAEIMANENIGNDFNKLSTELSTVTHPVLSDPVINVSSLTSLARFLESSQSNANFPDISVLPSVLRNIGKFVNERKQLKYNHERFKATLCFLGNAIDKQAEFAYEKLMSETTAQLAAIKSNERIAIEQIKRNYDLQIQKLFKAYDLKKAEMKAYYQNLEAQRREQARHFDEMLKAAMSDVKELQTAQHETEVVSRHFRNKILHNTASSEEWSYYIELLRLRIQSCNARTSMILQLASKVE